MKRQWNEDWNTFIDAIGAQIRSGANTESLTDLFGGRKVRWVGMVDKVDLDELEPSVDVDMPERVVELGHGDTTTVRGLHVPVADDAIPDWNAAQSGDSVLFEAILGTRADMFPPVEVKTLNSGRRILMIRISNGKLIKHFRSA